MNRRFLFLVTTLVILFLLSGCDEFELDGIGSIFDNINILSDLGDTISGFFDSIVDSIDISIPEINFF